MTKTTTKRTTKKASKRTATKAKPTKRATTKPAKKATAKRTTRKATTKAAKTPATAPPAKLVTPCAPKPRDPRLPAAGTTIVRPYKGKDYEIEVLESGFRWNGDEYRSLSKLASTITGHASINGFLWFRLTVPTGAVTKRATRATAAGRKGASNGEPAHDTAQQGAAETASA